MKVKDLIAELTNSLDPEEEVLATWWDRESVSDWAENYITPEAWSKALIEYDPVNDGLSTSWAYITEDLVDQVAFGGIPRIVSSKS